MMRVAQDEETQHDPREIAYRKILRRLIPFLIVCYLFAYIDRSNIGLAKLGFMHDLGFNEAIYGLAGGLFYLGYALFGVPSNILVSRSGIGVSLLRIMGAWGLFSAALALVSSPVHFYVLRFLVGGAEAGFLPGVLLFLSRWTPLSRRARFNAFFLAAIPISGVVGGPLGALILTQTDGWLGWAGWRWLFVLEGLPACLLGIIAWCYLNEFPADAPWLTAEEKTLVEQDIATEIRDVRGKQHGSIWPALGDRRFLALVPMSIAAIAGSAAIGLWLPTIIRDAGVKAVALVGVLTAIPYTAAIAAQYLVARSSDRSGERRWHSAAPVLAAAIGWVLLPSVSTQPVIALVLMTIVAMGTFAVTGPFWTMPSALLSGTAAAAGIATISTCGGLGAFFSPTIVGWLTERDHSFAGGAYFYAVLLAFGAVALLAGTAGEKKAG